MTKGLRRRVEILEEKIGMNEDWRCECFIPFCLDKFPLPLSLSRGKRYQLLTAEDPLGRRLFDSGKVSFVFWIPTGRMHRLGVPEITSTKVKGKTSLEVLREMRKAILGETAEGYTALYRGSTSKLLMVERHIQFFEEEVKDERPEEEDRQDSGNN
ncbi:MAG: hypothetical protein MUP17_12955 [candidate division Zixibacteria bacterium]|nr:hypothetical protein [candidate division Zixibacteria bacterium]